MREVRRKLLSPIIIKPVIIVSLFRTGLMGTFPATTSSELVSTVKSKSL